MNQSIVRMAALIRHGSLMLVLCYSAAIRVQLDGFSGSGDGFLR
jgi:hypothetical protein